MKHLLALIRRMKEGKSARTQMLLLMVLAVGYAENTLIGALGPTLERVFHFNNTMLGLLATASNVAAALAGFLLVGRAGDILIRKGHLNGRLWLGALGYILGPLPLFFALHAHTVEIALPLFALGAFFVGGAGPTLGAVRVDVVVARLRGRTESIRQVQRTVVEGSAPALFGVISGAVAGDGGLRLAFTATLPALIVSGLIALIALRTYGPDVAAALASYTLPGCRSAAAPSGSGDPRP